MAHQQTLIHLSFGRESYHWNLSQLQEKTPNGQLIRIKGDGFWHLIAWGTTCQDRHVEQIHNKCKELYFKSDTAFHLCIWFQKRLPVQYLQDLWRGINVTMKGWTDWQYALTWQHTHFCFLCLFLFRVPEPEPYMVINGNDKTILEVPKGMLKIKFIFSMCPTEKWLLLDFCRTGLHPKHIIKSCKVTINSQTTKTVKKEETFKWPFSSYNPQILSDLKFLLIL